MSILTTTAKDSQWKSQTRKSILNIIIDSKYHESKANIHRNGVTLRDTVLALGAYFAAPMSLEEKVERCANYPHPKCFLDRFKARIGYLLKDHPAPPQIDGL